jgi:predicted ATPase
MVEAAAQFTRALDGLSTLPSAPAVRRDQIKLQVALVTPLLHTKGYAAPETKAATEQAGQLIDQAEALGETLEDPLLRFSVLYGDWVANYQSFNGGAMRKLAGQFLALAEKQGNTAPLLVGDRIVGISLLCTGDIASSVAHFDRAIALYDPAEHRPLAGRFGHDARVAPLSYRSWALWMLGYPAASIENVERALKDAREIGQAATLAYAIAHASIASILCGSYAIAAAEAQQLVALAEEKGVRFWKPYGTILQGCVSALAGNASDAVKMMTSGMTAYQSSGSNAWMPCFLSHLARAYAELHRFDDACRCIREAMAAAETTQEKWYEAEIHRVAGQIVLCLPEPETAKAETHFLRALTVARQQQAKSWELRAATSMARLWRDQGKRQQAHDLLAPVYGWFTEGFDTLDLKEAKALLEQLRA